MSIEGNSSVLRFLHHGFPRQPAHLKLTQSGGLQLQQPRDTSVCVANIEQQANLLMLRP